MRILIVEDDETVAAGLMEGLTAAGFTVDHAPTAETAEAALSHTAYDLAIVDIGLPRMDGLELIRRLRRRNVAVPVLVLTARDAMEDRVAGLDLGADDYMTKPFRPRELVARVRAVLRRAGDDKPDGKVLKAADIVLDRDGRTVKVADQFIDLTPSEFDILAALMSSPGRVFSRLDLLDIIQGVRYEGYERTIDTHIKNLRGKIEGDPRNPNYIETVYGVGYRFKRE